MHVALLGDSIFDNAVYVAGGIDVIGHLRGHLEPGGKATLLARDGSRIEDVRGQLDRLPRDCTHLMVSAGGNNALDNFEILGEGSISVGAVMTRMGEVIKSFARAYRRMLKDLSGTGLPFGVCTIYYPRFPNPEMQQQGTAALAHFNDALLYEAIARGLPVIDLRHVCSHPEDYANPIEPSDVGGSRIAGAVARVLREHPFGAGATVVYTR